MDLDQRIKDLEQRIKYLENNKEIHYHYHYDYPQYSYPNRWTTAYPLTPYWPIYNPVTTGGIGGTAAGYSPNMVGAAGAAGAHA